MALGADGVEEGVGRTWRRNAGVQVISDDRFVAGLSDGMFDQSSWRGIR